MDIQFKRLLSVRSVVLLAVLWTGLCGFRPSASDPRKIVDDYLARNRFESRVERVVMVTLDYRGEVRQRDLLRLERHGEDGSRYALLRLLSPADEKGVALLSVQPPEGAPQQYLHIPAAGNVRRIAGSSSRSPFLGSDFNYEDLLVERPDEFQYERRLDQEVAGRHCYHIVARPASDGKAGETGYAMRHLWIARDDYALLKVDFFDRRSTLIKTLTFTEFALVDCGNETRMRPVRARVEHHIRKSVSMLVITEGSYKDSLPMVFFTPEKMKTWSDADEKTVTTVFSVAP